MHAAVLGSPIAHSLSPVLHRAAYAELGLRDWTLRRRSSARRPSWPAGSPTPVATSRLRRLLADDAAEAHRRAAGRRARAAGPAGRRGQHGGAPGTADSPATTPTCPAWSRRCTTPGSTRWRRRWCSVAAAPPRPRWPPWRCSAPSTVRVLLRDPAKAGRAAGRGGGGRRRARGPAVGTAGGHRPHRLDRAERSRRPAGRPAGRLRPGPGRRPLFDILYSPWPTRLAAVALAAGVPVVGGLDLLAAQAVGQVELMTGHLVDVGVLRAAGERALARS